ncbi:PAS domain-containing protein [candidate division WWE3 bacterium]|nr:PAS domain-containing protein [candidate division WWE3 bacterium]
MDLKIVELIVFFASSILTITFTFIGIPNRNLQQFIVILMVVLLFLFKKILSGDTVLTRKPKLYGAVLFICSLFVQLLIFSTGGFYSPFLIVIHLFTLGVGFLMSLRSSMIFLLLTMTILVGQLRLDPIIKSLFDSDPWSVVLYFLSFVAIIPLSQLLVRKYHLKEKITEFLSQQIQLSEMREESIMQGLSDLVIVVNRDLKIISVNESVRRLLDLTNAQIIFHPLLDVITLESQSGEVVNKESLSVDKILNDKSARMVDGLYLKPKVDAKVIPITIQMRPIVNLNGQVEQVVCVLNEAKEDAIDEEHIRQLSKAKTEYEERLAQFKQTLQEKGLSELNRQLEVIHKTEEDLLTSLELDEGAIHPRMTLVNLVGLIRKVVVMQSDYSLGFGVRINALLPQNDLTMPADGVTNPKGSTVPYLVHPEAELTIPADADWLSLLLVKLLDISILLSSGTVDRTVNVQLLPLESSLTIRILTSFRALSEEEKKSLFNMYYGALAKQTNLTYGSGLEGYLVKTISRQLSIQVEPEQDNDTGYLVFRINFKRSIK